MTAARQVLPGTTYLVTRRCSERRFFLKPSKKTNAIFRYLLAAVANRYGIRVHVYCVLSNHFHLVLTDPDGRLPDFHRDLDALIARAMNRALGRWENFWDPDGYSAVRLADPAAILEKMVYVLANPVAAGLVRRCADWPGSWSDPALIGRDAVAVDRPWGFFREKGPLPAAAGLQLHMPPGFDADGALADVLRDLLREAEERAATELARGGRAFVGTARILAQRPTDRPASAEPRRDLSPRVATRNKWKRVETLIRLEEFRNAYREALDAWKAGMRGVLFPPGTWFMRVHHGVCCVAPG